MIITLIISESGVSRKQTLHLLLISPTPLKQAKANIVTNDSLNRHLHHTTFPVFLL